MKYDEPLPTKGRPFLDRLIAFSLQNKLVVIISILILASWGIMVAPFDWDIPFVNRSPIPVDAIPDIGENQQIVFTKWPGRSPQDIEDQISYPLTVSLLGVPGVKTVRSLSMFSFSSIYIIFNEDIEFYWSRSRILEKLNSLPAGALPQGVQPQLGPDATGLGQIFWYTLEGRDSQGNPAPGWDPQELRSIQDWYVRYSLLSAQGISEVGSVGGFVKEYQIDVDPDAMQAYGITLNDVFKAIKMSNADVGARTVEINRVEYIIRGLGFIKTIEDLENSVITTRNTVPVYIKDVAHVAFGPAARRGALDKGGAEAVGGVVVVRYGDNPLAAIKNIKKKIKEITPGLPEKVLPDGTVSKVTIVPFYDRSGLIHETLETLNSALVEEILITIIVVIVSIMFLQSSLLISGLLPLAVLICFIGMKAFKVDANIVALSGIAIAIGTMVDMGIIISENILRHLQDAKPGSDKLALIFEASSEVGSAMVTAITTTIVSFLPVFTMTAAEGKLFKPLAYTKTFALIGSIIVAIIILPPFAHMIMGGKPASTLKKHLRSWIFTIIGIIAGIMLSWWLGVLVVGFALYPLYKHKIPEQYQKQVPRIANGIIVFAVALLLSRHWLPLGIEKGLIINFIFVVSLMGSLLGLFAWFQRSYGGILKWCLNHKITFLTLPGILIILGFFIWQGLGKEFMPPLDEGSYLLMPTTMPHAGMEEAMDILQKQDRAINAIPEVTSAVGKIGRADTPLDPAPVSMIETIINYKSEYMLDENGHHKLFRYNAKTKGFVRDDTGALIPDKRGRPFRQWRDHIRKPDDIWDEILTASRITGTTSAPRLQPIAARIVMLQSGMRAPMGIKVQGPDLATIERVGIILEKYLKEVPSVEPRAVFADRIAGKPYLEIEIDRLAIARHGIMIRAMQDAIEIAIGGRTITTTIEGRERYAIRVRYQRELRSTPEDIGALLISGTQGTYIPLRELATINFVKGPMVIKSEDTFLTGYVLFDKKQGHAEVDVVEECRKYLSEKIAQGAFSIPAGVSYTFAGNYENQVRSEKKLMLVLPLALFIIFMILYFQFKSFTTTGLVFSGILVAWAGGFIMIWLYGQGWFMNFSVFGTNMRELFNMGPLNLSVAVWVGFLALFGIASDDGVVMATYLNQTFAKRKIDSIADIRLATIIAAERRIRPCLMTSATTILALIPVLTSTGRGADVMIPMAIPSFGGMSVVLISEFVVPVLYSWIQEIQFKKNKHTASLQKVL